MRRPAAIAGIALLFGGTIFAIRQPPRREALESPKPWVSLRWWRSPIERNAVHRLTVFSGQLFGVYALRGTGSVWYVGSNGLVIRSTDAGRTWSDTNLQARVPSRRPAATTASLGGSRTRIAPGSVADELRGRPRSTDGGVRIAPVALGTDSYQASAAQSQVQQALTIVPDVTGRPLDEARKLLDSRRLYLSRVDTLPGIRGGRLFIVRRQSPVAGSRVAPGTAVALSIGPVPSSTNPPANTTTNPPSNATTNPPSKTIADPPADPMFFPRFNAVCFADPLTGWIVGENAVVFATRDGGATWTQLANTTPMFLTAAVCDRERGLLAIGNEGVARAGPTDTVVTAVLQRSFSNISLSQAGIVWGTSAGPIQRPTPVFRSDDFGASWTPSDSTLSVRLGSAVSFGSASVGFAAQNDSGLLVTRDGGATWQSASCIARRSGSRTAIPFAAVRAASASSALAVDIDGSVWRTIDGGQSCARAVSFADVAQNGLAPASDERWFAAADGAFASTDGGARWSLIVSLNRFSHIAFLDRRRGWAALAAGSVARTTNGGRTWDVTSVDETVAAPIERVVARTPRHIFAVGADRLYGSADGGASWRDMAHVDSTVAPVLFADSITGWAMFDDSLWSIRVARDGSIARSGDPLPRILATAVAEPLGSDALDIAVRRRSTDGQLRGWVVTEGGRLLEYRDTTWAPLPTSVGLRSAIAIDDSAAIGVDTLGYMVQSADGGQTWARMPSTPRKYPAPWFLPFVLACVAGTVAAVRITDRKETPPEKSVADILISDRPLRKGDRDVLDFGKIAAGLSRFLRNSRTEPPITIAITGPWGTGKSSLMSMLRRDLEERMFRTVWFNAWHHQREESLLASLLESIRLTATPSAWSWKGLRFRGRLLWSRFSRYALPLAFALPLFAIAVGYILSDPSTRLHELADAYQALVTFLTGGTPAPQQHRPAEAAPQRALLAVIVSVAGTVITYVKGLKAFGVNPAALAKNVAAAGKVRTSEAQPGFRYRFAQDFREVTDALKPERLVIFIDDLDRCKPEQVLELLEAVNFLVDSGDCVVILGIDRERVTGCVAIGFREVASVLTDMERRASSPRPRAQESAAIQPGRSDEAGASPVTLRLAPSEPPAKTELELQVDYARHYLEKLLNMEIPIPPATAEGLGKVMTHSAATSSGTDGPEPLAWNDQMRGARRALLAAATVGLVALGFWFGLRGLAGFRGAPVATVPAPVAPPTLQVDTLTGVVSAPAPNPDTPRETTTQPDAVIRLVVGSVPTTAWWQHTLLLAGAFAFLVWLLTPRESNRVQDSEAFAKALKAWAPVLFEEFRTPRAAKKFLNHVRFLSMAQRAPGEKKRPVDRFVEAVRRAWPVRYVVQALRGDDEGEEKLLAGSIPEVVLVSLSVIAERYPEWLLDEQFWDTGLRAYATKKLKTIPEELETALRGLENLKGDETVSSITQTHRIHGEAWSKLVAWVRPQ